MSGIGTAKVGHPVAPTVLEEAKSKPGLLNGKHKSDANTNKHLETNGATESMAFSVPVLFGALTPKSWRFPYWALLSFEGMETFQVKKKCWKRRRNSQLANDSRCPTYFSLFSML